MEHPDFVIDPFDQSKTDSVPWTTIGRNALPVGVNQRRKLAIRLQSLPPQAVLPALEKDPGTPFVLRLSKHERERGYVTAIFRVNDVKCWKTGKCISIET